MGGGTVSRDVGTGRSHKNRDQEKEKKNREQPGVRLLRHSQPSPPTCVRGGWVPGSRLPGKGEGRPGTDGRVSFETFRQSYSVGYASEGEEGIWFYTTLQITQYATQSGAVCVWALRPSCAPILGYIILPLYVVTNQGMQMSYCIYSALLR